MNSKTDHFFSNCLDLHYDIICVTETWLSDSVFDSELLPDQYNVIRCDRKFSLVKLSKGGGVLLAIKNNITFSRINTSELSAVVPLIDIVLCKCLINMQSVTLGVIYIPPNVTANELDLFTAGLEQLILGHQFILFGDFNLPDFGKTNESRKSQVFHNFINVLDAIQHNSVMNPNNNLLDLVFSSSEMNLNVTKCDFPLVFEDFHHPSISISLQVTKNLNYPSFPCNNSLVYNFHKANFPLLYNAFCDINWSFLNDFSNVNEAIESFYSVIYQLFDLYVPKKRRQKSSYPIWFTPEIKYNLKTKRYFRKKWLQSNRNIMFYYNEFKRLRSLTKKQISIAYQSYVSHMETNINSNSSDIWKFLNQKRGCSRIPGRIFTEDKSSDFADPQSIVNGFAHFFSSAALINMEENLLFPETCNWGLNFQFSSISLDQTVSIMKKLSNKFTAGDDLIPSFIVRDCSDVFAQPLTRIFNLAINTSTFPELWKRARVCPVFKKGDNAIICNYRQISILSNFAKVFEQCLYQDIYYSVKNFISPDQHGFVKGRSTVTNLALITQYIATNLDSGRQVDVIYTDFTKAFDSVSHDILLHKLTFFGFSSSSLLLLQSYLSNRVSYVSFNGFSSFNYCVKSGVPQGSNLGPLLFILFINDLLLSLSCPVLAYADDLKIFNSITNQNDADLLQLNLSKIADWCNKYKLHLNISKCCTVSFSRCRSPFPSSYSINNFALEKKDAIKDLGITFDSAMTFIIHVGNVRNSAFKSLGFVMRMGKYFSDVALLKNLYYAFVLSKIEYACLIWFPIYISHSILLDSIHRRFLKFLSFKLDGTYPEVGTSQDELLARHNIVALNIRREHICLNFLDKLLSNRIDCSNLLAQIPFNVPRICSRYEIMFRLPTPRTNILRRSPLFIICSLANHKWD